MPNITTLPRTLVEGVTIGAAQLEAGTIVSAAMSETLIKVATVSLTNAQVLALRATPITIVSAPGAGKVTEFISCVILFDRTAAYTETDDNLVVRYTGTTGLIVSQAIEMTGFIDAAADAYTLGLPKIDPLGVKTLCENQVLVLHNSGDGEFGGGNAANVVRVRTQYRVHPTGF